MVLYTQYVVEFVLVVAVVENSSLFLIGSVLHTSVFTTVFSSIFYWLFYTEDGIFKQNSL